MENRFPPIRSTSAPSSGTTTTEGFVSTSQPEFSVDPESISDLFYDGMNNFDAEMITLQNLMNLSTSRTILKKIYKSKPMNRERFRQFVTSSCDLIDGNVADELFSCSINQFRNDVDENGNEGGDGEYNELPDQDMTKTQFTTAIIRLANLWSLMNEGMAGSSQLTKQTTQFFKYIS